MITIVPGEMRQIPLDLSAAEPASFDNYVTGGNTEALAALRRLIAAAPRLAGERAAYLWGEPGTGKSHLVEALGAAAEGTVYMLGPQSLASDFERALDALADPATDSSASLPASDAAGRHGSAPIILLDDCDRLDELRQMQAFHLFNRVSAHPRARFVATGAQPPGHLALRDDLRTRLGWGLVLRLALLSDDEKAEALHRAARGRGIDLPDDLVRWLLTHRSRDIRWLLRRLDSLDRYALERKRAITLPLLREFEIRFS